MKKNFHGTVPDGLLYGPDHDMWARGEGAVAASIFVARAADPEWATLVF